MILLQQVQWQSMLSKKENRQLYDSIPSFKPELEKLLLAEKPEAFRKSVVINLLDR